MRQIKRAKWLRYLLIGVLSMSFVFSAGMVIRDLYFPAREQAANEALVERAEQAAADRGLQTSEKVANGAKPRDYKELHQENPDLAAWLTIKGTKVDYPVMYTPDAPETYLRKAFDGSAAMCGSLFIGEGCSPDGNPVIIYGHNMNDDTMFGALLSYADEAFARQHSVIYYDRITSDGSTEHRTYEVMGAFYSQIDSADTTGWRYYEATDLSHPENFARYINNAKQAFLYDLGVQAVAGDRLMVLSTCSYHTENGRFVVVAKET